MKTLLFTIIGAFITFSAFTQLTISGKVLNENGNPLIGASIQIQNTSIGTVSNEFGEYSLKTNLKPANYTIIASYMGYEKVEKVVNITDNLVVDFKLVAKSFFAEEIIVSSTRANENTPVTYSIIDKENLESKNMGQDLPYMLVMEPSLVTTSDAGAGVGYTGLWIRGSNIQRINVTINGIPLNDPESHGVFWVNMPDFTSSVNSVQIQRGIGTSTNGGGAFGATMNLETNNVEKKSFAEINSAAGSFNTFKNNVRLGSGLVNDKWAFEARLSKITSDGYIDRASSDLQSFYLQGGYYTDKTNIKAIVFGGKEKTYQSWYGIDQYTMDNYGRTFNMAGAVFGKNEFGETDAWNFDNIDFFYDNQTDNYQQDHYQLHLSHRISENLKLNGAIHYTYGRGYYEEFYQDELLIGFPISDSIFYGNDTITTSDMIVRRWLDNNFYGGTYALIYKLNKLEVNYGGAINKYADAKHFGELIWARIADNSNLGDKFYENVSNKTDFNNYLKLNYQLGIINLFADVQFRHVRYTGEGTDKGGSEININEDYNFLNPKLGFTINALNIGNIYGSLAIANREPIRTDFVDAPNGITPQPERLSDIEIGIRKADQNNYYNINFFYMKYTNQLVLTGEINDVGSPIRENAGESYRTGIEVDGSLMFLDKFSLRANVAFSNSKTDFKEEVYNYDAGITEIIEYDNVEISFSPKLIGGLEVNYIPIENANIGLTTRYVSEQYLDLTESDDKKLDAYSFTNLNFSYSFNLNSLKEIKLNVMINNVFDQLYSSNGYVYWGTPYYYPQAGRHFLAGITLRF